MWRVALLLMTTLSKDIKRRKQMCLQKLDSGLIYQVGSIYDSGADVVFLLFVLIVSSRKQHLPMLTLFI